VSKRTVLSSRIQKIPSNKKGGDSKNVMYTITVLSFWALFPTSQLDIAMAFQDIARAIGSLSYQFLIKGTNQSQTERPLDQVLQ
jgi:hypothetical protein